eukprot:TRINITY_DN10524_c0_g5_i5.p1 TRINITY_DN10524_c0_g5~~TRINITY_DN10524_c0_g5_i5.p1  ORF type:complete len:403 (-),score=69.07 TRINITY_DN10524_c0_g5_i5:4-1212(-)
MSTQSECKESKENWVCLVCGTVGCSVYQRSHMSAHCQSQGHYLTLSFSDMSFWCYRCDSYIVSPVLEPLKRSFVAKKFPGGAPDLPFFSAEQDFPSKKDEAEFIDKELLEALANKISKGEIKRVVVITGAGISVNAKVPGLRTAGEGLNKVLEETKLPYAEAVYSLTTLEEHPEYFYKVTQDLFSRKYLPTKTHYFIRLLQEKGILLRNYAQNFDGLELEAGVKKENLIQVHGSLNSGRCCRCKAEVPSAELMEAMKAGIPKLCNSCKSPCRPDIVFFGERLPKEVLGHADELKNECDLMIIMGTSLMTAPFCLFPSIPPDSVPRLVINHSLPEVFRIKSNMKCCFMKGDCDESIIKLVELLKWDKEFEALMKERSEYAKMHNIKECPCLCLGGAQYMCWSV